MNDIRKKPFADFLEGSVKMLAGAGEIDAIVIAARRHGGGTMTGSWKAAPEDVAVMCWDLLADAMMDVVAANAGMIRDALEDLEEEGGDA